MATKLPITLLKPSGIAGQVLTSNGPDDPPEWAAGGGGGTSDRPPSLRADFGGVGDGVTDDTAAILAAEASAAETIYVPEGQFYSPTLGFATLTKTYIGDGSLKLTVVGNNQPRGRMYSVISEDPGAFANNGEPGVGFQGDWSGVPIAIEHYILGDTTLGTVDRPDNEDYFRPNTNAVFVNTFNQSGIDMSLPGTAHGRRTAAVGITSNMGQYGYGDAGCFNANCFIGGEDTNTGTTLGGKAGILYNGQVGTGIPRVYLNPIEINSHDNGHADVAAAGAVFNMHRDHPGTYAFPYPFWYGLRVQSAGSQYCDVAYSAVGKWKHGIDFTYADLDVLAGNRAMTLQPGQAIYFCAQRDDPSGFGRYPSNSGTARVLGGENDNLWLAVGPDVNIELDSTATAVRNKPMKFYDGATLIAQLGGTGNTKLYLGAPNHQVEINQTINLTGQTTSPTAGALFAYLTIQINDINYKIPVHSV